MRDDLRSLAPNQIVEAVQSVPPEFRGTPQFVHDGLSAIAGNPVIVKVETVNTIGCFKGRGAWLAVKALVNSGEVGPRRGIVTASSGNFGQGVAYAGRAFNVPVTVLVPASANRIKIERMKQLNGEVIEVAEGEDAREQVHQVAMRRGLYELIDGRELLVAIGAGTIAVELTSAVEKRELPQIGTIFVPVGDAALITGVGTWFRWASPATSVIGVQALAAPAVALSWRQNRLVSKPSHTYADGIAIETPHAQAIERLAAVVKDIVLVDENSLRVAQIELSRELGITVEGAGAAAWAGFKKIASSTDAVAIIVSGSNIRPGDLNWSGL